MATTTSQPSAAPIAQIEARNLIEADYLEYGAYVNTTRSVPGYDGLKSGQRRVLFALRDVDDGSDEIPSLEVVTQTLKKYHPHGDASIYDTMCRHIHKGFIEGRSNFGTNHLMEEIGAAAYRYTYVKPHKQFTDGAFRFIDQVPTVENEYGLNEPTYLPVPIPLGLTTGAKGIGIGLLCNIPAFSPKSLFDALMADDPSRLKAPAGTFIVSGDMDKLWKTGEGWIQYGLKCYQTWHDLDGKTVSVIEGSGRIFKPRIWDTFSTLIEDESVYTRDESGEKIKMIITRVKGLKRITDEQVHQMAQQAAVEKMFFRIYVTENKVVYRKSMKDWMQELWARYEKVVDTYKTTQVNDLNHRIRILNLIPVAAPGILQDLPISEIAKTTGASEADLREVEGKSIKMLRKSDFGAQITDLNKKITNVQKISAKALAVDFVDMLEKAQAI
ncbi:DNA gyrase subunit A protein [Rhizobium phage RHph_TM40]|uniref:DNA gyrase subunit A protein n=2 Tax=Cuauhnahuacvirus TaxID=3044696 RepID=A0A7S5R819_9CAUD|nr:DNA gyrase subunit A protein [Rhizobium phage RHph_TM30]YP_010671406.1 DNA gyrase subunit A protein [Rhizobium phage RHph_Y65]QIG71727.1 DNA gyrase subunit A protein [Rhizobium phage RHph_TM40]QIG72090.1 DNA gyrase subunit A protein [Rhizobium phage RHph_TM2_3B]QIG72452.1 DNA gyrase subunit A protein [Rhizobium phage RHph_TM3_3_6]QIG71363.1 DNA gyrase subunit A protein [Rhizobium phage RHph_TM30]QIG72815.1 DNA gyrase subunit A protein [Rhizobium phage RHph_Y65]